MKVVNTLCIRPLWEIMEEKGTTCAIKYYFWLFHPFLVGLEAFELLLNPDDDGNSCSFFGNLFRGKTCAPLYFMKDEITGSPTF